MKLTTHGNLRAGVKNQNASKQTEGANGSGKPAGGLCSLGKVCDTCRVHTTQRKIRNGIEKARFLWQIILP